MITAHNLYAVGSFAYRIALAVPDLTVEQIDRIEREHIDDLHLIFEFHSAELEEALHVVGGES